MSRNNSLEKGARSSAETELDAEVETEQVGAILVLAGNVNVELARRDLSWQSDGLLELILAGRDGALDVCVVGSCLLANIESSCQESDETKLDNNVGKCAVLLPFESVTRREERINLCSCIQFCVL